jgi:hypothetical protein
MPSCCQSPQQTYLACQQPSTKQQRLQLQQQLAQTQLQLPGMQQQALAAAVAAGLALHL